MFIHLSVHVAASNMLTAHCLPSLENNLSTFLLDHMLLLNHTSSLPIVVTNVLEVYVSDLHTSSLDCTVFQKQNLILLKPNVSCLFIVIDICFDSL